MTSRPYSTDESLAVWLERLQQLDPERIELGLDRIQAVLNTLGLLRPPFRVITVGGTNGKGSVVAYTGALAQMAELGPIGCYTSPHLLDYTERIQVNGRRVSAGVLTEVFEVVESARGEIPLTYFEFGTVAALEVFRRSAVSIAVLEVGLGGRLDAVNALDAESAAVVSVGLDHQKWLGNDRNSIGREKAGIFRRGQPAIVGDRNAPKGLLAEIDRIGSKPLFIGEDFDVVQQDDQSWIYWLGNRTYGPFNPLKLNGAKQLDNAAVALTLSSTVIDLDRQSNVSISEALSSVRLPGRIEQRDLGGLCWVFDVAHNAQAAQQLADWLGQQPHRPTAGVAGILQDKDARAVLQPLTPFVERWYFGGLSGPRGRTAPELLIDAGLPARGVKLCDNIRVATLAARSEVRAGGRVVVIGSFHTVAEAHMSLRITRDWECGKD